MKNDKLKSKKRIKVILAKKYGFCMGVKRAIEMVERTVADNRGVTVLHQIVHNPSVTSNLAKKGVKSVEGIENVKTDTVIFSAHGVSPQIRLKAENSPLRRSFAGQAKLKTIDATCPLVLKVHGIVKSFAMRGYEFIYVGHRGHPEPLGVAGWAPERMTLIENGEKLNSIKITNPEKVVIITQTTLSTDDTSSTIKLLLEKFPQAKVFNTICFETTDRQRALKELLPKADVVVVVGGKNSSNSQRLSDIAKRAGKKGYLVENATELRKEWFKGVSTVGLTAGASTPDYETLKVKDVIERMGIQ